MLHPEPGRPKDKEHLADILWQGLCLLPLTSWCKMQADIAAGQSHFQSLTDAGIMCLYG
jgi:hypothetical protein